MGPCGNLGCASPQVSVVGGNEGLLGEAGVTQFVSEGMGGGLGTLENGDVNVLLGFSETVGCKLDTEITADSTILDVCADGGGIIVSDCLGKRLEKLVVEPLSSLDISSEVHVGGVGSTVVSPPEQDCCFGLKQSLHSLRDVLKDRSPGAASPERSKEQICQRFDCGPGNTDSGNINNIESGLRKISFDATHHANEKDSHNNTLDEGQVPSDRHFSGPYSGCTDLHVDSKASVECSITETVIHIDSHIHATLMDNGSGKDLLNSAVSRPDIVGPAFSIGHAESSNCEDEHRNGNAMKNGDICESKCSDNPLALRRSSRSRKTVLQVQRGESVLKSSKMDGKLSLSRTIDLLSEITRKKRSCISRSKGTSGWGLSSDLSKYFVLHLEVTANQSSGRRKSERKAGDRSRKRNTVQVTTGSPLSVGRQDMPCCPIRLKVTFGKREEQNKVEDTPPVVFDGLVGVQPGNVDDECNVVCYDKGGNEGLRGTHLDMCSMSGKCSCCDSSQLESEKLGSACVGKFLDPGTSPDSEVIDQVLDSSASSSVLRHNSVSSMSGNISSATTDTGPASSKLSKCKINKKDKLCLGNAGMESDDSPGKAEQSKKDEHWPKHGSSSNPTSFPTGAACENPLSNSSKLVSMELLPVAHKAPNVDNPADSNISSGMIGNDSAESGNLNLLFPTAEIQRKKKSKGPKSKGKDSNKSRAASAKKNMKEPSGQRKGSNKKLASACELRTTSILDEEQQYRSDLGTDYTAGNQVFHVAQADPFKILVPQGPSFISLPTSGVGEQTLMPRVAWVCCDDCNKWRCIPAQLADKIEETNRRWTCIDNRDQAFADCSIPQEKSDSDINIELQLSDEEDGRGGRLCSSDRGFRSSGDPQHATWMFIKSNIFLHRSRKTQTMDEIMVCHCEPPADGTLGCGDQCLNRMLNIECVQGTCPCRDLCSNQSFQRRQYAKLSWFRSGKKGYGLQVLEDISDGQFLIEYVGEVLDLQSYEARQKEYASMGHKHFYFMTLNGNEVIDACGKGNVGRFVNHSCDPNCRTEKWVVNGEICVGLFALRKIRKGEELTFDYNYVRVFGAAAKKCYCGTLKCRGYIGGDPANAEVIVHGDSDDEFPEPVVVDENGKIDHSLDNMIGKSSVQDCQGMVEGDEVVEDKSEAFLEVNETIIRIDEPSVGFCGQSMDLTKKDAVYEACGSSDGLGTVTVDSDMTGPLPDAPQLIYPPDHFTNTSTSPKSDVLPVIRTDDKCHTSSSDSSGKISEVAVEGEQTLSKARPRMKISRPSKSVGNRKFHTNVFSDGRDIPTIVAQKSQVPASKPKKQLEGSATGHHGGVEEKLNELLDSEGGICKKKDASRGYLKLLLLTVASGDSGNAEAIQSNRELSMILDAILKTKSRAVLLDIINKNGLQMLHNMMKNCRKLFQKTPILRKLLKVLEFLAEKEILSVDHIIVDPLRPGVESFMESIFLLAEHEDKKVHQTARNFRDKWIPRPMRKYYVVDRSDQQGEFSRVLNCNRFFGTNRHGGEHGARMPDFVECVKQPVTAYNPSDTIMHEASSQQLTDAPTNVTRPHKRKSRWDQPADPCSSRQRKEQRIGACSPNISNASPMVMISEKPEKDPVESRKEGKSGRRIDDVMQDSEDDVPPGFPSLQIPDEAPPGFSSTSLAQNSCCTESPSVVSVGLLQEKFNPRVHVAHGIPVSVLQQFGALEVGMTDSWAVALAIPFQPFPPLPPHPRGKRSGVHHFQSDVMTNGSREEVSQNNHDTHRGLGMASTSGACVTHSQNSGMTNRSMPHRTVGHHVRGSWNGPGRRHHKQRNLRRPWFRNMDGRGCNGSHP